MSAPHTNPPEVDAYQRGYERGLEIGRASASPPPSEPEVQEMALRLAKCVVDDEHDETITEAIARGLRAEVKCLSTGRDAALEKAARLIRGWPTAIAPSELLEAMADGLRALKARAAAASPEELRRGVRDGRTGR